MGSIQNIWVQQMTNMTKARYVFYVYVYKTNKTSHLKPLYLFRTDAVLIASYENIRSSRDAVKVEEPTRVQLLLSIIIIIIIIISFCSFVGKAQNSGTYKSHFDGLLENLKWERGK